MTIKPLNWYFYTVKLDGKSVTLPISGISLTLRMGVNRVLDKALEIASRDAHCSLPVNQEAHGKDCPLQGHSI